MTWSKKAIQMPLDIRAKAGIFLVCIVSTIEEHYHCQMLVLYFNVIVVIFLCRVFS